MPLVPTLELVERAARSETGIGAFNVVHLETAEALVEASRRSGLPVILQISQNCVDYHGSLAPIAESMLQLARDAGTMIAVHLDHAERRSLVD